MKTASRLFTVEATRRVPGGVNFFQEESTEFLHCVLKTKVGVDVLQTGNFQRLPPTEIPGTHVSGDLFGLPSGAICRGAFGTHQQIIVYS